MSTTWTPDRINTAVDRTLCTGAWAIQILAAAVYCLVADADVWRSLFAKYPANGATAAAMLVLLLLLWPLGLLGEQRLFYNRTERNFYRRIGLLAHVGVLLISAAGCLPQHDCTGLLIALGFTGLFSTFMWIALMNDRRLPDEDQAVVDAILSKKTQQASALHHARQNAQRQHRLGLVINSLGYRIKSKNEMTQPAPPAVEQPEWKVPDRQHKPLVYFLRNGNRIKIGTTTQLKRRIRTLALRPQNVVLLLDGGQRLERELHGRFASQRVGNTEWFTYQGDVLDYVNTENARALREADAR